MDISAGHSLTKTAVRKEMKRMEREFLSDPGRAERETRLIWQQVEMLPAFRQAERILIYLALPGEVPTEAFLRRWPEKHFCIPRVEGQSLILHIYDPARLHQGYQGIWEPDAATEIIRPETVELAFVPGVAFARIPVESAGGTGVPKEKFLRLGHGGGFYDRLLPQLHCPKIGLAFRFRLISELPADPWDILLDGVCTAV